MGLDADMPTAGLEIRFEQVNLAAEGWEARYTRGGCDGVLAFAVLHHIPSEDYRSALLRRVACLIKPGGLFIHSEWQFHNSPRLLARVQPWRAVGLSPEEVEEGDTLLDWRYNGEDESLGSGTALAQRRAGRSPAQTQAGSSHQTASAPSRLPDLRRCFRCFGPGLLR